jgi:hypothetical protein
VSTKPAVNEAVVIAFRDAAEFEAWLDAHVDLRVGVWRKIAKKGSVASGPWCKRATGVGSLEPPSTREDLHPWHDEYRLWSASAPRLTSCSDRTMTSP